MASSVILVVPCSEQGHGGGHLTRCASLVKDLRAMGREARLFLPQNAITEKIENLIKTIYFNPEWIETNEKLEISNDGFIVLDRFQTPPEELLRWKSTAPVIGIDEGGAYRNNFDFLIDILIPEKMSKSCANIFSPALVLKNLTMKNLTTEDAEDAELLFDSSRYPQDVRKTKDYCNKVLITFGHEDTAGLGLKTARSLSVLTEKYAMDITLLRGSLAINNEQSAINNVRILDAIPNLAEHLCEYDLVITHYGITAYEALYAGVPVLLAHPTPYHKKLSKAAGFTDIKQINKILSSIPNQNNPAKTKEKLLNKNSRLKNDNKTLAGLTNGFYPQVNRQCPSCAGNFVAKSAGNFVAKGSAPPYLRCSPLIARYHDRTYRRCNKCGIIYMDRTCPPPVEYAKEYFFESYKNQYGKTYLEDFDSIKIAGKRRLKHIIEIFSRREAGTQWEEEKRKKLNQNFNEPTQIKNKSSNISNNNSAPPRLCENSSLSPRLLDIGCAYGPFLSAAKEEGFSPFGIDPAKEAVRYVQQELGIPAIQGFFPLPTPHSPHSFDVITLWYVIEHFKDCVTVLAEIKRLLKPNGILAFSTPSFSGISGRKNLLNFLSASPADHYTVWSPKTSKKALALSGFKVKKIVSAGHHPERFPLLGKFAKSKKTPVYWLLLSISKIFSLGDTFEVYAQTKKEPL